MKVLHRNSLKLCTVPQVQPPVVQPREGGGLRVPMFYYIPNGEQAAVGIEQGEAQPKRSSRPNKGQPPERYGD